MEIVRKPKWEVMWVATEDHMKFMLDECSKETLISLDTETANWDARKGGGPSKDYLALIQVGIPRTERTFIVDALAFTGGDRDKEAAAFTGLKSLLEDTAIEFIIQYAPFERRHLKRSNVELADCNVSDTKVIAQKVHPGLRQLGGFGLANLCKQILNKEITKGPQTSDWTVRPLTQEQVDYAALDPEITYEVYEKLREDALEDGVDVSNVKWVGKKR